MGVIVTGINEDWELVELTGSFKLVEKRHFAETIKEIYDEIVTQLKIENKVNL